MAGSTKNRLACDTEMLGPSKVERRKLLRAYENNQCLKNEVRIERGQFMKDETASPSKDYIACKFSGR